ncbi:hypothetical protein [Mesorhizobium captivum]|uniref:hypothetical protein n=1 Tax=Mesorhizobium captivum TaxID=3072319 RepID=UPI002A24642F|nr:hypothetical protein [Mesorhizobium sp. VK3C]MDX8447053.1 hypothetical protein [Mesorhizobium sp. VK3C]
MASNARAPRLATGAAQEIRSAWRLNNFHNSQNQPTSQDVAALVVAQRYRLSLPLARTICDLAQIGGRLA